MKSEEWRILRVSESREEHVLYLPGESRIGEANEELLLIPIKGRIIYIMHICYLTKTTETNVTN